MRASEVEIAGLIFSSMLLILATLHLLVVMGVSKEREKTVASLAQERRVYQEQGMEVPEELWADPDLIVEGTDMSRSPIVGWMLWLAGLIGIVQGSFHLRWWYVFFIGWSVMVIFFLSFFCIKNCETNPGIMGKIEKIEQKVRQKF